MNKKFLSAVLFGALMVSSTGTFVSCKDYDEDIDRIDKELVDIKSALSALQAKVDAGKYVTNVVKNGDGITVTWSDNSTSTIETIKGDKGCRDQGIPGREAFHKGQQAARQLQTQRYQESHGGRSSDRGHI